ncbi:Peptidase S41 family protein [Pleurostoma richardsiae]|uniref:Peptidase S41 family protein n=1 Tax=Pleurostoma richardsiae TaxID=41990 RepID=A0AA38RH21_9PEZI|nr:Peptidase S41 family protein [Pleurostoma richardsiae]
MSLAGCRIALLFAIAGAAVVSATPAPQVTPVASNPDACAAIDSATASLLSASPEATPTVLASVAYDCLQSVPNKNDPAQKLIQSLKGYVQWQSTLAWLKDPPSSYMLPATDIEEGLDIISANAGLGTYASEYEFQLAIVELLVTAHDGHFAFRPDVFKAFTFRNALAFDIVSVSRDGIEMPKLYHYDALTANGTTSVTNDTFPPAITMINGEDAATVIERLSLKYSSFQDPDSQWNSQFQTYATPDAIPIVGASLAYLGPNLTLTYDNGEEKTEDSFAIIRAGVNFSGVATGEDFYDRFCNPEASSANAAMTAAASSTTTSASPTTSTTTSATVFVAPEPTISGYPYPVVRDSGANATAGYFLNGTGYDDVAVLSLLAFAPSGDFDTLEYLVNYQNTVADFLAKSKEAGKNKLVIDVTANGGGFVVAGYDLFAQLFPDVIPFQADNLRLSDSLKDMALISNGVFQSMNVTAFNATATEDEQLALAVLQNSVVISNLVPGGVYSPTGANLTSTGQILGPIRLKGDLFTAFQQTPLNDTSADFNLTGTGTGPHGDPPPAVFEPENVVLLTDGTCGSTCTLFSYLLIMQLNIKATVVGGRPRTGAMQSIAGVEGAQVFPLDELSAAAQAALVLAPEADRARPNGSELEVLAEAYALSRLASAASAGAVNGKNAFTSRDALTPLQFLYQPANCRFFYTADMIRGPAEVWRRAVDATWTDPERFCVEGSLVPLNGTVEPDGRFAQMSDEKSGSDGDGEDGGESESAAAYRTGGKMRQSGVVLVLAVLAGMVL